MHNSSQQANEENQSCSLKIELIPFENLLRNELIFHQGDIWRCQSINMEVFQNLSTKQQRKITKVELQKQVKGYLRIEKLQLIPKQWKYTETKSEKDNETQTKITLKGQQLGLGAIHDIEVTGMRRFQELQVVRNQKEKGRDVPFKVILCKTQKPGCYLIAGIDFLN